MNAVTSPLSPHYYYMVKDLWKELKGRFGVRSIYQSPYPHFSYHVAARYDMPRLTDCLQSLAASSKPFTVRASGLGVFTGESPVLFVRIVRSPQLSEFHARLWETLNGLGEGVIPHYHATNWIPHITLGMGDVTPDHLALIIQWLQNRPFRWQMTINALLFIEKTPSGAHIAHSRYRFPSS